MQHENTKPQLTDAEKLEIATAALRRLRKINEGWYGGHVDETREIIDTALQHVGVPATPA